MKNLVFLLFLSVFTASVTFAAFPVTNSSNTETVTKKEATTAKKLTKAEKKEIKEQIKEAKKAAKEAGDDDNTIAIILAIVSVIFLPFGLHNWYLGRTKQALWQTLLIFPGLILIIPALISWIWQIVDLFKLLGGGLD